MMTDASKKLMELFVRLADSAQLVRVSNGPYCAFNTYAIEGDDLNELITVSMIDDEQEYAYVITESAFDTDNLPAYDFATGTFELKDSEGYKTELRFYTCELLKG